MRADIETGNFLRLNLPDWRGGEYTLQAIHMTDSPPGPAGRWLIDRLVTLSDRAEALFRKLQSRPKQSAPPGLRLQSPIV